MMGSFVNTAGTAEGSARKSPGLVDFRITFLPPFIYSVIRKLEVFTRSSIIKVSQPNISAGALPQHWVQNKCKVKRLQPTRFSERLMHHAKVMPPLEVGSFQRRRSLLNESPPQAFIISCSLVGRQR